MRNQSPLASAARRGDLALVNALLKAGAHPDIGRNATGPWGSVYSYSMARRPPDRRRPGPPRRRRPPQPRLHGGALRILRPFHPAGKAAESRSLPILRALGGKGRPQRLRHGAAARAVLPPSRLAHVAGWKVDYHGVADERRENGARAAAALLEAGASVNFGYSFVFGLLRARLRHPLPASYGSPQVFDVVEKAGARLWFANYTLGPLGLLISQSPMIALAESSDDFRPEALEANLALMRSLIARGSRRLGRWIGPLGHTLLGQPAQRRGRAQRRMAQVLLERAPARTPAGTPRWGLGMFVTPLYQSAGQERREWDDQWGRAVRRRADRGLGARRLGPQHPAALRAAGGHEPALPGGGAGPRGGRRAPRRAAAPAA